MVGEEEVREIVDHFFKVAFTRTVYSLFCLGCSTHYNYIKSYLLWN